jgi:hypothetical protein
MTNFSIGRNPVLAKAINWVSLAVGGCLWLVNVHFSSEAMRQVAINSADAAGFMPVAAGADFAGMFSRYATAFAVSLACLLISGAFLHPAGLPTIFRELRQLQAGAMTKMLGMLITITVASLLMGGGVWAYHYDLMTTALAFGVNNLWSLAAFPVWLNVVGPEFFFHGTHFYGKLQAAPASRQSMPQSSPTAQRVTPPPAQAAMPNFPPLR